METNGKLHVEPTAWQVPDDVWEQVRQILIRHDPPKRTGRKRIGQRQALTGILYHLQTGCCWNGLPRQFGDDSSVHRTWQRWKRCGAWTQIGELLRAAGLLVPDAPRLEAARRTAVEIEPEVVL